MSMYGARLSITILIAALIAFVGRGSAFADSPSVTAVLSNSEVAVGETVRLQIRITGSGAKPPGQITVDGLEIRQTGTEQHYEMNNFSVSQSVVYNYTVLPMKAGKFKIPPQTVQVGGSTQRTQELTLNVTDSGGHSSQSNPNTAQQSPVAQGFFCYPTQIVAIERDDAGSRIVETRDQTQERALARASSTDQRHDLIRRNLQVDSVEDRSILRVAETDILKCEHSLRFCYGDRVR